MALTMNAGGRELLFRFTVRAWVEIEEKLGSLNRLLERIDSDDAPVTAMIALSAATATAGNRYRGIAERVTEDDLIDSLSPMQILSAISKGYGMITGDADLVQYCIPQNGTFYYDSLNGSSVLNVRWTTNKTRFHEMLNNP